MDNNNLAFDIANLMQSSNSIVKKLETLEGLGIPEDKKEEFKNEMKKQGADQLIADLKNKMENLKNTLNKANGKPD